MAARMCTVTFVTLLILGLLAPSALPSDSDAAVGEEDDAGGQYSYVELGGAYDGSETEETQYDAELPMTFKALMPQQLTLRALLPPLAHGTSSARGRTSKTDHCSFDSPGGNTSRSTT